MTTITQFPKASAVVSARVLERIEALATLSEMPNALCRRFASIEHRRANDKTAEWMRQAGMKVHEDAMGNIIGRYEGIQPGAPAIMLGSHLDTVVDAGKYDGMLGVLSALACVEELNDKKIRLPNAIEVVGFADEEGVRYQSTFLGSRAIAGTLDHAILDKTDKDGISMRDALTSFGQDVSQLPKAVRKPGEIAAYVELHIEQGPVLESAGIPVGVVTSISGATRLKVSVVGTAGHAGTVPMPMRQDALVAAAKCVVGIQELSSGEASLVGTVGQLDVKPGASNVIPGLVEFSVDIRAASDQLRQSTVKQVLSMIETTCKADNVGVAIETVHNEKSIDCDSRINTHIGNAIASMGLPVHKLASGAGHDAAAMAAIAPVGMIFVRCKAGISHNPAEYVNPEDILPGVQAMLGTLESMSVS